MSVWRALRLIVSHWRWVVYWWIVRAWERSSIKARRDIRRRLRAHNAALLAQAPGTYAWRHKRGGWMCLEKSTTHAGREVVSLVRTR